MGLQFLSSRLVLAAALCFLTQNAVADCTSPLCHLATDGVYNKIVIGTLTHVASDEELAQVVHWAKQQGYWQSLPSALAPYLKYIKLVTITSSASHESMTLFIMQREYEAAPLNVGDRVRYRPHSPEWEASKDPKASALFHGPTGCVATLCAQADSGCLRGFRNGVFTLKGKPINPETGKLLPQGIAIDPISLRPVVAP